MNTNHPNFDAPASNPIWMPIYSIDPSACDTYSLHNNNPSSGFPGDMYRYIKDRYNVSVGQKCWLADEDNVYPCTIIDGSTIVYHADGNVSIGIYYENKSVYFGLYSDKLGAEDAHNRFRDEINFEES